MTWESILKERLQSYEGISRAAIHGVDGTRFASSPNFNVSITISAVPQVKRVSNIARNMA